MSWTRTSTPVSVARAELIERGQTETRARMATAVVRALAQVRLMSREKLSELGTVQDKGSVVWVVTDVGVLVVDGTEVDFWPPDWVENSGSGNQEPTNSWGTSNGPVE